MKKLVLDNQRFIDWPVTSPESKFAVISAVNVVEKQLYLIDFMDRAWDTLMSGGTLYIETPLAGGDADKQYADPAIVRCYRLETFQYFTQAGVHLYGYTQKPWAIIKLVLENSIIKVALTPIK